MMTQNEIADKALNQIDLSIMENIFLSGSDLGGVSVSFPILWFSFLAITIALFAYFNRGNYYSYYHADRALMITLVIVGVILYIFGGAIASTWTKNIPSINKNIAPIVAKIKEEEIVKEQNLTAKLNSIVEFTDKSGKIYYVERADLLEDNKKQKHFYLNNKNYQKTYVEDLKKLENQYEKDKNIELAKYLKNIFLNGNQFIYKNKKKSKFYNNEIKKYENKVKKEKLKQEKSVEVEPIKKVNV
jgi:hypothetical protein